MRSGGHMTTFLPRASLWKDGYRFNIFNFKDAVVKLCCSISHCFRFQPMYKEEF